MVYFPEDIKELILSFLDLKPVHYHLNRLWDYAPDYHPIVGEMENKMLLELGHYDILVSERLCSVCRKRIGFIGTEYNSNSICFPCSVLPNEFDIPPSLVRSRLTPDEYKSKMREIKLSQMFIRSRSFLLDSGIPLNYDSNSYCSTIGLKMLLMGMRKSEQKDIEEGMIYHYNPNSFLF